MSRMALIVWAALAAGTLGQEELDPTRVEEAIARGVAWLEQQQLDDGTFGGQHADGHPLGLTAIGTLTLAKCGGRDREAVALGYQFAVGQNLSMTYDVGLFLMLLEALYAPTRRQLERSSDLYITQERKNFQKLSPRRDKDKAAAALDWILDAQGFVWGYGQGDKDTWHDHSSSQYAFLGIGAAHRLGLRADYTSLYRALDHLLDAQERSGPEVEWFAVPAADHSFREILRLEKDLARNRKKERDASETVERVREFSLAGERVALYARGFGYHHLTLGDSPGGGPPPNPRGDADSTSEPEPAPDPGAGPGMGGGAAPQRPTLSMTTAGLAMLVIAKSVLEGDRVYDKLYARRVNQAIRDAAAWIAHNFSVVARHQYYYLYGLERAGILSGCHYFGEVDWYVEAGNWILDQQRPDGSWVDGRGAGAAGAPIDITTTCFALLFLKRATVPLIPELPKRVATGE